MIHGIVYIFCIFITVWQGIIFVGNALNNTLETFSSLNILLLATGVTGIILRAANVWVW